MGGQCSQFLSQAPEYTLDDAESQEGKVFIVMGGASGIGYQLAKFLYYKRGTVYIADRSQEKAKEAILEIRRRVPHGGGRIEFLPLALDDLASIKASVEIFKSKETQLHVLWNNAGVSQPSLGIVSKQGIELQLATDCLGPFLLTMLLMPLLEATAAQEAAPPRVIWSSSQIVELSAPTGGRKMDEIRKLPNDTARNYTNSKTVRRAGESPPTYHQRRTESRCSVYQLIQA